ENSEQKMSRRRRQHPAKRRLTTENVLALAATSADNLPATRPQGNSSRGTQASGATVHQYSLRARLTSQKGSVSSQATINPRKESARASRHSLGGSLASEADTHDEEESTPERQLDDQMPRLLPEELECVRRAIEQTCLPLWVDRLPLKLGAASAGSLKAAKWGILYTVFYPLVLLPLWDLCEENNHRK
ncbi:hypothetical protein PTTG_30719, partial [Puccinia triticina 1-1 BBBD Race 1]